MRALLPTLLALALASHAAEATPQNRSLDHQGVARSYLVTNAEAAAKHPRALVVVLHGRRPQNEANRTSPVLDAIAEREGFVAVYPAAIAGAWNYPTRTAAQIPISMVGREPADDMGFLTRLIDKLVADRIAMPERVYVSGSSMGGFMTFALMCAIPERITAAASLIATMTERQIETCKPARVVPALMIAGTADKLVPFDGRKGASVRLAAIPETLAFWWGLHGCSGHAAALMVKPPKGKKPAISTLRIESTGCRTTGALVLYRVEGGGHTLPSLHPSGPDERKRYGARSTDFETSEEVWAFFRRFTKP